MNNFFKHDYTHCIDYKKDECPKECFRAEVTQELLDDKDFDFPVSWAHFRGTQECFVQTVNTTTD